eukprot:16446513-Heterocapsa_arctica.AAC.1
MRHRSATAGAKHGQCLTPTLKLTPSTPWREFHLEAMMAPCRWISAASTARARRARKARARARPRTSSWSAATAARRGTARRTA